MSLFKGKYRVESARLKHWDYASAGWYFVTICTREKQCFFGEIVNGNMKPSRVGEIVAEEWQRTSQVRLHVELDEWIVMPNHLHGIIVLEKASVDTPRRGVSTKSTLKSNSLGAIIGQFKSVCTKRIWAEGFNAFAWQTRFYDHIIRDEKSLRAIREYVVNNPAKWESDKEIPAGLYM